MANYDSVLERTAVVVVVDDSNLQAELKRATDAVKRAAKDQSDATKTVAKGTGDAEKGFAELRAELNRLREQTVRIKRDADAYLATQKQQAAAARADAAAQKELDGRIKELGLQVRNTRSAFINGRIAQTEFERSSESLKGEINELLDSTTLTTAQQLKLNIASATAQRGLSSVRGEASRLGLAWNVQIGLANQFQQQLRGLGPIGAAAAGGLGLIQNGFAGLQRPIDLSGVSLNKFLASAARAPQVLALAGAAATTLAVVGMARLATNAAKVADDIDKASQSAGLSAEAFQEFTFALSQNGVTIDQARQGLNDFNARLGQAARGSTGVAKAYAELDVAIRDGEGNVRSSEAVFTDLIGALSGVESASLQAAIGGQVFGEEFSRRIIPALKGGAEGFAELRAQARELGLVISGDAILSLVEFKDEMAVLERQFGTARVEIAAAFLPILRDVLMPLIQNTVVPWIQTAADKVGEFTQKFTDAGPEAEAFRQNLVDTLAPLIAVGQTAVGVGAAVYGAFQTMMAGAAQLGAFLGTLIAEFEQDPLAALRAISPLTLSGANDVPESLLNRSTGSGGRSGGVPAENALTRAQRAGQEAGQGLYEAALKSFEAAGGAFTFDPQAFFDNLAATTRDSFRSGAGAFRELGNDVGEAIGDGVKEGVEEALAALPGSGSMFPTGLAADLVLRRVRAEQAADAARADRFAMLSDRGLTRGDGMSGIMAPGGAFNPVGSGSMFPTGQAATLAFREVSDAQNAARDLAEAEARANQVIIDSVREAGRLRRQAYLIAAGEEAAAAAEARDALLESIGTRAVSDRGRTRGSGLMAGGDVFTPPGSTGMFPTGLAADLAVRDATARQQAAVAAEAARAGQFTMLSDRARTRGDGGLADAARIVQEQRDAADAFAQTVTDSALTFANGIVNSIRNGDIGQAFQSLIQGAQSIAGGANFGSLSFLGGSIPIAGLISGAIGLIGNIFGGLFGGGRDRAGAAARPAGANVSGAPAVSINVTQNIDLAVASLVGSEARQAFDRANADLLRLIETSLLPRIGRLERSA